MKCRTKLILLITLISVALSKISCPPDEIEDFNRKWEIDYTDDIQRKGYIFRTVISDNQYEDYWNGLVYEPIGSICFDYNTKTKSAIQLIDKTKVTLLNDDIPLDTLKAYSLYKEGCKLTKKTIIPINFSADDNKKAYDIIFDVANPTDKDIELIIEVTDDHIEKEVPITQPPGNPPYTMKKKDVETTAQIFKQNIPKGYIKTIKLSVTVEGTTNQNRNSKTIKVNNVEIGPTDYLGIQRETYYNMEAFPEHKPQGIKPANMLFYFQGEGLIIITYSIMYERSTTNILSYNGGDTGGGSSNCQTNKKTCIENYYCKNNVCDKCADETCLTCDSRSCLKCPPNSPSFLSKTSVGKSCVIDFMDFTKLQKIELEKGQVPPAIHWRVTLEFWTYIQNVKSLQDKNVQIVYKDFLTVILMKTESATLSDIQVSCIPIEWLYSSDLISNTETAKKSNDDNLGAFMMEDKVTNPGAKWFYTRCAFNLDVNKAYLNDVYESILPIPQIFSEEKYQYLPFQMKKFYKKEDYSDILLVGFEEIKDSFLSIRNLNIYREYIPQTIQTKYVNMHKLTSHSQFPQLLFSIPFDDFSLSGGQYSFKTYNYFDRVGKGDGVIIKTNKVTSKRTGMMPPRNFYRMNFLDPDNMQAAKGQGKDTCEYHTKEAIRCDKSKFSLCFDEDKPFVCSKTLYLDPATLQCENKCPKGYIRPPIDWPVKDLSYYCTYRCDSQATLCPWNSKTYTEISGFTCMDGFFNLYYKCHLDGSNVEKNALFFSRTLNSHSIVIDLGKTYRTFAIEAWIYYDQRFQALEGPDPKDKVDLTDKVVFLTNYFRLVFGNERTGYPFGNIQIIQSGEVKTTSGRMTKSGWNHLIFSLDEDARNNWELYASFNHDEYNELSRGQSATPGVLQYIFFCNKDSSINIVQDICKNEWIDGYYRDIKVWDLTYTTRFAVFFGNQFSSGTNVMLKHHYTMHLDHLKENKIIDSVGNRHGYIPFVEQSGENPDNHSFLNYESSFNIEDLYENKYAISVTQQKRTVQVDTGTSTGTCNICKLCDTDGKCLKCPSGNYALFESDCKTGTNFGTSFIYKNPGINMPRTLELNIHKDDLAKENYVTIFFYLKLYGFVNYGNGNILTSDEKKIIIFDEGKNFFLGYDATTNKQSLYFYYETGKMFEFENYRKQYFGHWVPISISAFRETQRDFTRNMVSASIYYENLELNVDFRDEMPRLLFSTFKLTNNWIGLLSDIRIYNHFMVDAWGLVRNKIDYNYYTRHLKYNIKLTSDTDPKKCLLQQDLVAVPQSSYQFECYYDYNPHFLSTTCGATKDYVEWNQKKTCTGNCGSGTPKPDFCLGYYTPDNPDRSYIQDNASCDNVDKIHSNYYLTFDTKVRCSHQYNCDFSRFNYIDANVKNPQSVFSIDFWFYTQSFRNNNKDNKQIDNFNWITITWDEHFKIKIASDKVGEPINQSPYTVTCIPLYKYSKDNSDDSGLFKSEINSKGFYQSWQYINCGVDKSQYLTYLSRTSGKEIEKTFTSSTIISTNNYVKLMFREGSKYGFGVTYLREIRLWNCYDCSLMMRNQDFSLNNLYFSSVLHCFGGTSPGPDLKFSDEVGEATGISIKDQDSYPGQNILEGIGEPLKCNEQYYEYYNADRNSCEVQINLGAYKDFEFTVSSSRTGRYTVAFWFFIEDSIQFSQGVNIIYKDHMSITLIRDQTNTGTILGVCFPQAYRENVDGKKGNEVFTVYDGAVNKAQVNFHDASNKWLYVRCSMDQSRNIYALNEIEYELLGEIIYDSTRNWRPFRYFDITKKTLLKVQGALDNYTRFFLRSLRVYREFMDYKLDNIKYVDLSKNNYIGKQFWPLVFICDFKDNTYWYSTRSRVDLKYLAYDETDSQSGTYYIENFQSKRTDVVYSSYPELYVYYLCESDQQGGGKDACTGGAGRKFCDYGSGCTKHFYPEGDNQYLNMDTLKTSNTCGDYTRLPDSIPQRAYCLRNCLSGAKNIAGCANSAAQMSSEQEYSKNFKCETGYTRVYYECVKNDLVVNSAMFFSNTYSFNSATITMFNTKLPAPRNEKINSYYLEFWFKLDSLNYRTTITQPEFYLLAPPHKIIQDDSDQKFKYGNYLISGGTQMTELPSISTYEWNRIIIKTAIEAPLATSSITVYVNYNFEQPEIELTGLTGEMYLRGIGFCNQPFADCEISGEKYYIRWGVAWYRNIRVWEEETSSLELIQSCEVGYNQLLKSMHYYFPFSIDYIDGNHLLDRIDKANIYFENKFWFDTNRKNYDNEVRENYSVNTFDYSYLNSGNFIAGLTDTGKEYQLGKCDSSCKRCYSSSANNCYECNQGYYLYGKECKKVTGYYFKTPVGNSAITELELSTNNDKIQLANQNPLTLTIWIKFYGVELNGKNKDTYYPIFTFNNNGGSFGFEKPEKKDAQFHLKTKNDPVTPPIDNIAFSVEAKEYIGKWTHFGISLYRSAKDEFPNMFNFMINRKVQYPNAGFDIKTKEVIINMFKLNMNVVAVFSDVRFYSNFWFGTFGHINSISSSRSVDLMYEIKLFGSATTNCISDTEINGNTASGVQPNCVGDYLPYDDSNNLCSDNDHFIDLDLSTSPPCDSCDSLCLTQCFDNTFKGCSSAYNQGKFWIRETPTDYYSERVDSINFAFYEKVTVSGLKMPTNDEYSLEFWVYIYEYNNEKFDSLDVIWDKLAKVSIGKDGVKLKATCSPFSKTQDSDEVSFNKKTWFYIRCMGNRFTSKFRLNIKDEKNFSPSEINQVQSSLTIADNTAKFNYGFSFIREVKLFSSYNFKFWDASKYILIPKNYDFLFHYFRNTYDGGDFDNVRLFDEKESSYYKMTRKTKDFIGYNYVSNYEPLESMELCNEGYCYNQTQKSCTLCSDSRCIGLRDNNDKDKKKCLRCAEGTFLDENDDCTGVCSGGKYYYGDEFLSQCRECHSTCATCFGKYENNCMSCEGNYYFFEEKNTCVTSCEAVGQISDDTNHKCTPFKTIVTIRNGEGNDIKKFKPLYPPEDLKSLKAEIDEPKGNLDVGWEFSRPETIQENADYRGFEDAWIGTSPFTSNISDKIVNLNTNFFRNGLKYVFYLGITSSSGGSKATVREKFIIEVDDDPIVNRLVALPSEGYKTTNFLFVCDGCEDDTYCRQLYKKDDEGLEPNCKKPDGPDKGKCSYRFTYFTDKNDPTTEKEIPKDSGLEKKEVLYTFPKTNPPDNEYTVRCYCKDFYGNQGYAETTIKVYEPPTDSKVSIDISESIKDLDVDDDTQLDETEKVSNRAEFLSTITIPYPENNIKPNRTQITSAGADTLLTLFDPEPEEKDEFCNGRGTSYMIDRFLTCDCSDYFGVVCQIDADSFTTLTQVYSKLYKKAISMQSTKDEQDPQPPKGDKKDDFDNILNTVHLLVTSGSLFMPIDNISFMTDSIEYVTFCMKSFKGRILTQNNNYYKKLIEIYFSLVEYGMFRINDMKMKNFKEENRKITTDTSSQIYDRNLIRNSTLKEEQTATMKNYFDTIMTGLDNLLKFFANNKFEIKIINRNLNIYVAVVSDSFDFEKYFADEISEYQPYFDVSKCISHLKTTSSITFKAVMIAKVWKISPFMQNADLYYNNTSPVVSIDFIDYKTGKKIFLNDCLKNEIEVFFPVSSYIKMEDINEKKDYLSPEKQFDVEADIFTDPVYIDSKGNVDNSTTTSRISEYFVPFNLSCRYYDDSEVSFVTEGLDFANYTKDNYVKCTSTHLTDFVIEHYNVSSSFTVNTRFFYLKHYMLLSNWNNYKGNQMLKTFIVLIITYFLVLIVYSIFDIYFSKKVELLTYVKSCIVKANLPYRENYDFDDGLNLETEIKQRLNDVRAQRSVIHERNGMTDINNIKVGVAADKVGKYEKEYIENRNIVGEQNKFFGMGESDQHNTNYKVSNFFRTTSSSQSTKKEMLPKSNKKEEGLTIEENASNSEEEEEKNKSRRQTVRANKNITRLKKFFNEGYPSNPPRKVDNDHLETSDIEIESKDGNKFQQGKAKNADQKHLAFYDQSAKQSQIFQRGYDTYKPKFAKPKVISQKMNFFNKDEKPEEKDNSIENNPIINDNIAKEIKENREADVRAMHERTYDSHLGTEEPLKENLPKLFLNLTYGKRLLEFDRLTVSFCKFFGRNLLSRHMVLVAFANFNIFYSRYKRIGNFIAQLSLYTFFLSIMFTADSKMEIMNTYDTKSIVLFIVYCLSSAICSNLLIHLTSFMFYIDVRVFRVLYNNIKERDGLIVLKDYENLMKKKFWWNLLGTIIQWIFIFASFYFSFCFCSTYYYQRRTFLLAFLCTLGIDVFILEIFWELFIAAFFALRHKGKCLLVFAEFLNRTRSMKALV